RGRSPGRHGTSAPGSDRLGSNPSEPPQPSVDVSRLARWSSSARHFATRTVSSAVVRFFASCVSTLNLLGESCMERPELLVPVGPFIIHLLESLLERPNAGSESWLCQPSEKAHKVRRLRRLSLGCSNRAFFLETCQGGVDVFEFCSASFVPFPWPRTCSGPRQELRAVRLNPPE